MARGVGMGEFGGECRVMVKRKEVRYERGYHSGKDRESNFGERR